MLTRTREPADGSLPASSLPPLPLVFAHTLCLFPSASHSLQVVELSEATLRRITHETLDVNLFVSASVRRMGPLPKTLHVM